MELEKRAQSKKQTSDLIAGLLCSMNNKKYKKWAQWKPHNIILGLLCRWSPQMNNRKYKKWAQWKPQANSVGLLFCWSPQLNNKK